MSIDTQIAQGNVRLEFFICIEGIGYPSDPAATSSGFDGTVYATNDFNGDLASTLGCTAYKTLNITNNFDVRIDTRSVTHSQGSLSFTILDDGDVLRDTIAPHAQAALSTTVNTDFEYGSTTLLLDGNVFDAGDTVWLGGREAVKLGTESGAGPYTYTGCTRGYLGTPRGPVDSAQLGQQLMIWQSGLTAQSNNTLWSDRVVRLYYREPGGTLSEIEMLWQGKLRSLTVEKSGYAFSFGAVADLYGRHRQMRRAPLFHVHSNKIIPNPHTVGSTPVPSLQEDVTQNVSFNDTWSVRQFKIAPGYVDNENDGLTEWSRRLAFRSQAYHYRPTPGGTKGLVGGNSTIDIISKTDADGNTMADFSGAILFAGAEVFFRLWNRVKPASDWDAYDTVIGEATANWSGQHDYFAMEQGVTAKVLLDNILQDYETSRFQIDREVRRNPIDFALMIMTTMPGEFEYTQADAGSSATSIVDATKSWATDQWKGYTVFSCDGSNHYYSAIIESNTATTLTLKDDGFPSTVAAGEDFQIRNTKYDVLPLTWGMGIHHDDIDIPKWEQLRDRYFAGVDLGRFAMGTEDELNLVEFLQEHIFKPFGIVVVRDRSTGKIVPRYIGEAVGDGIEEDYIAITKDDIYDIGDTNFNLSKPIGTVTVKTRQTDKQFTQFKNTGDSSQSGINRDTYFMQDIPSWIPGEGAISTVVIKPGADFEQSYYPGSLDTLQVSGALFSDQNIHELVPFLVARARRYLIPPATVPLRIDLKHLSNIELGGFLNMTYANVPINAYALTRGYSNMIGRVVQLSLNVDSPTINVLVELYGEAINGGLVVPSAKVIAHDATSPAHYEVEKWEYTTRAGHRDYYDFAVGDTLARRDIDGVVQHIFTVASFGTNQVADPTAAATDEINYTTVSGSAGFTAGDYITYDVYDTAFSANMKKHVWLADGTTEILTSGSDEAYDYS